MSARPPTAGEDTRAAHLTSLIAPESVLGRADEVVQRLREAINLGLLNEGDRLPAEVDLAAQFGVAAMTVRESLATLRDEGLVETRRGRSGGSFIRRPEGASLEQLHRKLMAMTISELRDLTDEHQAIAGQAARLAAERAAPVNVRRLFALTEQLESAATPLDRVRADCRFHIELAVAAQSVRLTRREVGLQAEISDLLWLPPVPEEVIATATEAHHAIAAAVLAEDGPTARERVEHHLADGLRRLTELRLGLAGRPEDPGG